MSETHDPTAKEVLYVLSRRGLPYFAARSLPKAQALVNLYGEWRRAGSPHLFHRL
jgi:hypothetical protein